MSERTIGFSVEGRWLTDHVRSMVLEGNEDAAFRILSNIVPEPANIQDIDRMIGTWNHVAVSCAVFNGDSAFESEPDGRLALVAETGERRNYWRKKLMAVFGDRQKARGLGDGTGWFRPIGVLKMTANTVFSLVKMAEQMDDYALLHEPYTRIALANGDQCTVRWDRCDDEEASNITGRSVLVVFQKCDAPPIFLAMLEEFQERPVLPTKELELFFSETHSRRWGDPHHRAPELQAPCGSEDLSYSESVSRTFKIAQLYGEQIARDLVCGRPISEDVILKYAEAPNFFREAALDRLQRERDLEGQRQRQPKAAPYALWAVGKEEPCVDIRAGFTSSLLSAGDSDVLEVIHSPTDEDIKACVSEIRRQADHSGWITFPLDGDRYARVPKGAFECYSLGRCDPGVREQATDWLRISGRHWKQLGDCRYHTDWILGGSIHDGTAGAMVMLTISSWDDVEGLSDAAYAHMENVQRAARESADRKTYGPLAGEPEPYRLIWHPMTVLCGEGLVSGRVVMVQRPKAGADAPEVPPGTIAILPNGTAPYEPVMRTAAACILAKGGKTCHLVNIGRGRGALMVRLDEVTHKALAKMALPWPIEGIVGGHGLWITLPGVDRPIGTVWGTAPVVSLDLDEGLCSIPIGDEE